MNKPGTGCKDAPRCWSLQLAKATNQEYQAVGTLYDDEFVTRHINGELALLATKHVDDLKVAGPPDEQQRFQDCLERHFGKGEIDVSEGVFTCCGTRHTPLPGGAGYELDQIEYLAALKPIASSRLVGMSNDDAVSTDLAKLYLSLLMALAFTLITRVDLHVYVVALQRHTAHPTAGHVRKLNTLVRWAQQNPLRIRYPKMGCANRLEVHSDAAFRKEQKEGVDAGRALRGAVFLRMGLTSSCPRYSHCGAQPCHLLDWQCGALKTVTRSTFTSELMSAISSTDHALALAMTLHEVLKGPRGAKAARDLRDGTAPLAVDIELSLDSMGVVTAVTAPRPKPLAE
jgi:hypothetical protein